MASVWNAVVVIVSAYLSFLTAFRVKLAETKLDHEDEMNNQTNATGHSEACCCWKGFSDSGDRAAEYRMKSWPSMCGWNNPHTKTSVWVEGLRREPKGARPHLTVTQPLDDNQAEDMKDAFKKTKQELLCKLDPMLIMACYFKMKSSLLLVDDWDSFEWQIAKKKLGAGELECPLYGEPFSTESLRILKQEKYRITYFEAAAALEYAPSICMTNEGAGSGYTSRYKSATRENLHLEHFGLVGWLCPPRDNENKLNFAECSRGERRGRLEHSVCADAADQDKLPKSKCTPPPVK